MMVNQTYRICFDFLLEQSIRIHLMADVEMYNSDTCYVVQNFRTSIDERGPVLPALKIKRKGGSWVHLDTERDSLLSDAVGQAIDLFERERGEGLAIA